MVRALKPISSSWWHGASPRPWLWSSVAAQDGPIFRRLPGKLRKPGSKQGFALYFAPADVAAAEALGEIDPVNRGIGAILRFSYGLAARCDVEHTATLGNKLAIADPGTGMKHFGPVALGRRDAADCPPLHSVPG